MDETLNQALTSGPSPEAVDLDLSHIDLGIAVNLVVALAIGLLIGLEREWRKQGEEGEAAGRIGIRTFGIIGLFGGLAGTLQASFGPWLAPAALIAITLLLVADRRADGASRFGALAEDMTTLVAAITTALLGLLAATGAAELAVAAAVVVVTLLYLKPILHGAVGKLTDKELKATVRFLVISLVVLPILPNQDFGPYRFFNPRETWLLVVLISALSFIGYFAIRYLGAALGCIATGLFGGLVSSTATTITFARMASDQPKQGRMLATGVVIANAVMAARILVVTGLLAPSLAMALALPMGLFVLTALGMVVLMWHLGRNGQGAGKVGGESLGLDNPFELRQAIKFALLLAAIGLAEKYLSDQFGTSGLLVLAAIAGLADVDAITIAVSRDAGNGAAMTPLVAAILIAAGSNTIVKAAIVARSGGVFARWGLGALAVMALAAAAGAVLQQMLLAAPG
ncbi:uncharacterized membrane protein (DUF4010 family) [Dongia mobilis]|uniref:Uncharacterized membrane protein (DUF4010 family) n=1 Tax=Dongia mobilis TaxID=578943 RepID=A0A4R6WWM5_9PROT|nr:MgtC/SapB family protein [Dongia mobilis]TDQ83462.1 uncharacterized membrane protein (DUF4010 family) [Dongia mobilis]